MDVLIAQFFPPSYVIVRSHADRYLPLALRLQSSSKCYLRIQSVPQREHNTSPLQRSTG
jgi:hypothetical protein